MLAFMSAAYGFAYSAQNNIITNYFTDILHFKGPEFGYITAVREVGGFLLIFMTAVLYRVFIEVDGRRDGVSRPSGTVSSVYRTAF